MKKIRNILAMAMVVMMIVGLMPGNVFAEDTRIKINNIVATSNTDSIPTYGGTYKRPTFKVTEGKPAYFAEGVAGYWLKKEGEEWNPYGGTTFTEGTYKYKVQIRIDGWTGTTYVLDSNGVTATVDGNKWADNRIPAVGNSSSYVWTESKEYIISKTSTATQYTVTFDANGGSKTMTEVKVNKGDSYTLPTCTFTPPTGKEFDKWEINGTKYDAGDSIAVNGDITVKATWKDKPVTPEKVTLTTNIINGGGTVTVTPASATVDKGKTIVVTFNPETNYEIDTVTLDGTDVKSQIVSNKLTITMDKSKTLWVGFKEKPITPPPTVQSIKVISTDHKTEYKVGDSLDVTNLKIEATMSDGTKEQIFVTKEMVSGFDSSTAGIKTLTITCGVKTASYTVTVTATPTPPPTPTVKSIAVNSATHKTAYTKGEALDVTNLTILVTMSNGATRTENVTADMVSGFDTNTEGTQTLTITYQGKTASYTVTVTAGSTPPTTVTSITVNSTTHKTAYKVGDTIDLTGLTIEAAKSDGTKETVTVTNPMISGFDTSSAGTKTVTITYGGKTTSYTVTVTAGTTPPTPPTPDPYYPEYDDWYEPYRPHRPHRPAEDKKTEEKPEDKPNDKPAKKVETEVILAIDSNNLDTKINGTDSFNDMDVAPYIKNGRTMMPIANIARALGLKDGEDIIWDNVKKQVVIRRIKAR